MNPEPERNTFETKEANKERLAGLYDEYFDKIARYAFVRIGDRNQAEDIAGDVFLKALESINKYQERGLPIQAWLFKIAHNLVVDHLRKTKKQSVISLETIEVEPRNDDDPAQKAETRIEIEKVSLALKNLTEEQREVLNLRFFGGLTSKEVGSLLNKNDGAVREMQRAAIEKLRQLLVTDEHQG